MHKTHAAIFNFKFMQTMSVHKSLHGLLNINIFYFIILHILTLAHVLHICESFYKYMPNNLYQQKIKQKKIVYVFILNNIKYENILCLKNI